MTNWYSWPNSHAFDEWHQTVIDELGLPRVGFNQATGEPELNNAKTTAYTNAYFISDGDWRAFVEPEIASKYSNGLGLKSTEPNWRNLG